MSAAPARMITLKSSDEQTFVIQEAVALQSKTLEHMIVDNETENIVIPLTTITGSILAKVIEYLNKHGEAETSDEDKKAWDSQLLNFDFITNTQLVFDIIQAANFLNIKGLLELASHKVGDYLKGKTPEDIHRLFNTHNGFAPEEEEEEVRKENRWAFQ
ncbi:hypothetical protein MKW98_029508 [Papaver atlanticum]|uniref:SKP1-like protein n=1 Tax=Papaver atlanticum TaxID=357466 RepID=A0AAD4XE26_9MAGN|nr:hypothetical protein MKW98_029508 [Papaver atlanticum]